MEYSITKPLDEALGTEDAHEQMRTMTADSIMAFAPEKNISPVDAERMIEIANGVGGLMLDSGCDSTIAASLGVITAAEAMADARVLRQLNEI